MVIRKLLTPFIQGKQLEWWSPLNCLTAIIVVSKLSYPCMKGFESSQNSERPHEFAVSTFILQPRMLSF